MAIIKLTDLLGETTYLNKNHIVSFYITKYKKHKFTLIMTTVADYYFKVKETPEENLALIKEAENGK